MNNKNRLLKNLNFMANIIEAAKEENIEKNKNRIKNNNIIKDKGEKPMNLNSKTFIKDFEDLTRRMHGKSADLLSVREAYETLCRMVMSYAKT